MRRSNRTFGWFQDASSLETARIYLESIAELDTATIASAIEIAQSSIEVGRWADESYVRFLHALGFIEYDREDGVGIAITESGWSLLTTQKDSEDERTVFRNAVLSYPPACRILQMLVDGSPRDKFELAQNLGFVGERGFLTFSREIYDQFMEEATTSEEAREIRSNKESTNEKYARMIADVLRQLGIVRRASRNEYLEHDLADTPHAYRITPNGREYYNYVTGHSIRQRIHKRVPFEMLASRRSPGSSVLRERRALLLEELNRRQQGIELTSYFEEIQNDHPSYYNSLDELNSDISGLINCGIGIRRVGTHCFLNDQLILDFPLPEAPGDIDCSEIIERLHEDNLVNLAPEVIENTINNSYSGVRYAEFEEDIHYLFSEIMEYYGEKLGGPNAPDSLIWYEGNTGRSSYGLIVDTKSRRNYFNLYVQYADQMRRYIEDYTDCLMSRNVDNIYFLWVSSGFRRGTQNNLSRFSSRRGIYGSCLSAPDALFLADRSHNYNRTYRLSIIEPLFYSNQVIEREDIIDILEID